MRPQVPIGVLVAATFASVVLHADVVRAEERAGEPVEQRVDVASSAAPVAAVAPGVSPAPPAPSAGAVDVAPPPTPPPFGLEESAPALTASEVVQPMVKTIVALSIVLLLAWLTLHKGMGRLVERAQAGKRLRVVERVALDARRSLFLVEVDGKTLVVGGGDLVRLDAPQPSAGAVDPADLVVRGAAFEKVLATSQSRPSSTPTTASSPSSSEPA